jgi:hypothetical protein
MTDTVLAPRGRIAAAIALLGLTAMVVLSVLEVESWTRESGDRPLYLSFATAAVGLVTLAAAITWVARARRKAGAIVVLVASILLNPTPLLVAIRILG